MNYGKVNNTIQIGKRLTKGVYFRVLYLGITHLGRPCWKVFCPIKYALLAAQVDPALHRDASLDSRG